jgi:Flp pilus assembly protein TadD
MLRKAAVSMTVLVALVCVGCESMADTKKAAQQRWQKATSAIKLNLAQQQYDDGKYEQASKTVQECISAEPEIPQAHLLYGKLLLNQADGQKALEQLQTAVELDQQLDEGWYWQGVAAQQLGLAQQARLCYGKAMALKPSNIDYILAVAEFYAAQREHQQAVELLEEKIKLMPGEISLKVAAADLLCRTGQNKRASELYRQAMLMSGNDSDIAEALGYCYLFSGEWKAAAEIFDKLSTRCNDRQKEKLLLEMAALCSINCAEYGRAVNCYNKLSVDQRTDAEIWLKMGQAALGAGAANRALMCGQKALDLKAGYADAIALIGCAQYVSGDYLEAVRTFEKITAGQDNATLAWLMKARCYERLGRMDKATLAYRKALETNPHSQLANFLAKGQSR